MEWLEHTPPFYTSVDLRNAGFKLAPVDTNLYPGGWNNLTPEMLPLAVQAAQSAIEKICPEAKNLLLIPENHTRNTFYLTNVDRLKKIFQQAGLNVRIGTINPEITEPTTFDLPTGESVTLEPVIRSKHRLGLKDFDPCTILLNNDLSAGTPAVFQDLNEQHLLPPLHAGWFMRRKSTHFAAYDKVAESFANLIGIDPWLINPYFSRCGSVNFAQGTGMDCLTREVDTLLKKIQLKYDQYGITEKPFVIVKADNGTYGMGIMTVRSVKDLEVINRKTKNKMSVVKDGQTVSEVIIQEGVQTMERVNEAMAEPVVYMLDRYVVGGFYRVHAERGIDENLNAPGASFVPLAFANATNTPELGEKVGCSAPNRFYMYGVIARLAMLAASYELEMTDPVSVDL
jgi:glutamate--cysteine ligase